MTQFRRRFRSFPRRSFGSKKQVPRWTALTADITLSGAAANNGSLILVNPENLLTTGVLALVEQELKVVRLVGQTSIRTSAGNAGQSIGLGILRTESTGIVNGGFQDPLIQQQLVQRDWLRVMNTDIPLNATTNGWIQRHEFDIRVQRNLKSNQVILLAATNAGVGDSVVITIDARILIVIRA